MDGGGGLCVLGIACFPWFLRPARQAPLRSREIAVRWRYSREAWFSPFLRESAPEQDSGAPFTIRLRRWHLPGRNTSESALEAVCPSKYVPRCVGRCIGPARA